MIKSVIRVLTSTLLGAAVLCAGSVALVGGCSECNKCHKEKPCSTCGGGKVVHEEKEMKESK